MENKAHKLIIDFKKTGWKTPNLYKRIFELAEEHNESFIFCKEFLLNFEESATIFNDSLSYITEEFKNLIAISLDILKRGKNKNAEEVILYGSLQFPHLLHEHIKEIYDINPNEKSYYNSYPYRNLPKEKIKYFLDMFLDINTSKENKQRLFDYLLQTRDLETIKTVMRTAEENKLFDVKYLDSFYNKSLENVGYTKRNGTIYRKIC